MNNTKTMYKYQQNDYKKIFQMQRSTCNMIRYLYERLPFTITTKIDRFYYTFINTDINYNKHDQGLQNTLYQRNIKHTPTCFEPIQNVHALKVLITPKSIYSTSFNEKRKVIKLSQ